MVRHMDKTIALNVESAFFLGSYATEPFFVTVALEGGLRVLGV